MPSRTRQAYDTIKRQIIELELPPGASFTEGELAATLNSSKTPVREALVRLRQEGLVEAMARSGYRVAPVTLKHARDLFQVRALLEVEAAGMAASNATDLETLKALEKIARQTYDASKPASIKQFMRNNTRFHVMLAQLGGNEILADMLHQVLEQLERLFHLGLSIQSRGKEIVHEHQELLVAIKAGDAEGARRIATEQAASSQLMVLDALLASDTLLSTNIVAAAE